MHIPPHLVNEHFDDRYFDVVNAIQEARLIYIHGAGIAQRFPGTGASTEHFGIGETGFGAGRLLITLLDYLDTCGAENLSITYTSVELYPITALRMNSILSEFRPVVGPLIDLLVKKYGELDIARSGWHELSIQRQFGTLTLKLYIGEALEMIKSLTAPCDAWFLDGHGPKKNPAIWRHELLMAVGEKTRPGGTVATYTVAGDVRRSLASAGFVVEKTAGFGGKKSVLKGVRV